MGLWPLEGITTLESLNTWKYRQTEPLLSSYTCCRGWCYNLVLFIFVPGTSWHQTLGHPTRPSPLESRYYVYEHVDHQTLTKVTSRRGTSRRPTTNSQGVRYFSLPNWKALQAVDKSLRVEIELATTMTRVKKIHTKLNLSEKSKLKESKMNFRLIGGSVQDPAIPGNAKPLKVKAAFWKWKDLRSKTNAQITLNDKLWQIT